MSTQPLDTPQDPTPDQDPTRRTERPERPVRFRATLDVIPAYKPGKPPAPVEGVTSYKMSSNENPYPPLPSVLQAAADALTSMNRYPDPSIHDLTQRLATELDVDPEALIIGNGSSGVLSQIVNACVDDGDEVIYAWRSFELYPICVAAAGGRSVQVPLTADGRHDLTAMAAAVRQATRIVIVCTPNNPTGPSVGARELEDFLAAVPSDVLVLIDEAYLEFVTASDAFDSLAVWRAHPNVVLLRTFSKAYGLAGLRVGYAIGHPRILDAARSTSIPLSVTAHAEEAALASLDREEELLQRVRVLAERRDRLAAALRAIGWKIPDAQGNFVWLPAGRETLEIAEAFSAAGLIVRPFAGDGLRISVGEEDSVEKVLWIAASVVKDLPEDHSGRGLA